ncbi:hypothetical protein PYCCODRAFT_396567 [Trametes coccinea BRFM310]|uniref:Uncharacterized protein n=1 Tax=Trametes coccinea (strain BRFM310) TaxID=1353009 RepID=A0A1Y2J467_TRAC3|nr:hypothetical protein PYCCODRAFT_396567 [Trametes coccinea BRFM310]
MSSVGNSCKLVSAPREPRARTCGEGDYCLRNGSNAVRPSQWDCRPRISEDRRLSWDAPPIARLLQDRPAQRASCARTARTRSLQPHARAESLVKHGAGRVVMVGETPYGTQATCGPSLASTACHNGAVGNGTIHETSAARCTAYTPHPADSAASHLPDTLNGLCGVARVC